MPAGLVESAREKRRATPGARFREHAIDILLKSWRQAGLPRPEGFLYGIIAER
ncbi:hypothetical protein AAE478_006501 [Parahypoxylon ruwenzoriense]